MIADGFLSPGIDPGKAVARCAVSGLTPVDQGNVDTAPSQAPGDSGAEDAGADNHYDRRFLGNDHQLCLLSPLARVGGSVGAVAK